MKGRISQIKAGAMLSYLQMATHILISIIYTPVMLRLLGTSEYGLYNTVASTVSMLSVLRLGFNNCYVRYYSRYKKEGNEDAISKLNGMVLSIFLVTGIVAALCGGFLTNNLEIIFSNGLTESEYSTARVLMILLTVNLAITFPMSVFSNIISAHERYIFLKILEIIKSILGPFITLPLLLIGFKSIAMVTVSLTISIVVDVIFVYYVIVVLKNRFVFHDFEKGLLASMFGFTFFIALELIVDQVNWNVDKVLLARFRGTKDVAVYSVGYSLFSYYLMFSSSISGVFTPRVHCIVNEYKDEALKLRLTDLFTRVGRIQFLILGLISTGVLFFGRYFITVIWAGKEYADAFYVAIILIGASTVPLIQNVGIEIQRAQNKHQFRSIVYFFMLFINLGLTIILCQKYGAIGSATGTAFSLVVANGIIMNIFYQKRCNIDIMFFWKQIIKMLVGFIPPITLGIVINLLPLNSHLVFFVGVPLYTFVYLISIWYFAMNHYEKELIISMYKKVRK